MILALYLGREAEGVRGMMYKLVFISQMWKHEVNNPNVHIKKKKNSVIQFQILY